MIVSLFYQSRRHLVKYGENIMKSLTIFQTINYNWTLFPKVKNIQKITFATPEEFQAFVKERNDIPVNGQFSIEVAQYSQSNRRLPVYNKNAVNFFHKYAI
jgi:hypothetical protein